MKWKTQTIYERLVNLVEGLAAARGMTVFNRPVKVMSDFERPFINAVGQFTGGASIICCFFHFVANVRKQAQRHETLLKDAAGQNKEMIQAANRTKRALMMLPLLPEELISTAVVDLVVGRWKRDFPNHNNALKPLRDFLVRNYAGPRALYPPSIWSVSGRKIRTNNAAESCHSRLNASIRVSGAVTLDMFLVAIETEMRNTSREIKTGCKSHAKKIFERRDELLAVELAALLRGDQGVLRFLDHCASITNISNKKNVQTFIARRAQEPHDQADDEWREAYRQLVQQSAVALYHRLVPGGQLETGRILATVENWSFQKPVWTGQRVEDESELSMVEEGKTKSVLEIEERIMR